MKKIVNGKTILYFLNISQTEVTNFLTGKNFCCPLEHLNVDSMAVFWSYIFLIYGGPLMLLSCIEDNSEVCYVQETKKIPKPKKNPQEQTWDAKSF